MHCFSATLSWIRQPFPVVPLLFLNGDRGGRTALMGGVTPGSVREF
jgi:hypothetical protein